MFPMNVISVLAWAVGAPPTTYDLLAGQESFNTGWQSGSYGVLVDEFEPILNSVALLLRLISRLDTARFEMYAGYLDLSRSFFQKIEITGLFTTGQKTLTLLSQDATDPFNADTVSTSFRWEDIDDDLIVGNDYSIAIFPLEPVDKYAMVAGQADFTGVGYDDLQGGTLDPELATLLYTGSPVKAIFTQLNLSRFEVWLNTVGQGIISFKSVSISGVFDNGQNTYLFLMDDAIVVGQEPGHFVVRWNWTITECVIGNSYDIVFEDWKGDADFSMQAGATLAAGEFGYEFDEGGFLNPIADEFLETGGSILQITSLDASNRIDLLIGAPALQLTDFTSVTLTGTFSDGTGDRILLSADAGISNPGGNTQFRWSFETWKFLDDEVYTMVIQ